MASLSNESSDVCTAGLPVVDLNDEATAKMWYATVTRLLLVNVGIPAVLTVGIPANLAFLFMLYRVPHMRTLTSFYLANLAVSDTLHLCLYSFIYTRYHRRTRLWPLRETSAAACVAQSVTLDVFYFASCCLIILVAVERYHAVCHPLRRYRRGGRTRHAALVALAWAFALAVAFVVSPRLGSLRKACIVWPEVEGNPPASQASVLTFCWAGQRWSLLLGYYLYAGLWAIGVATNVVLYVRIVRRLSRRTVGPRLPAVNVRNRVARMLIVNGAVFFTLQMPRAVVFTAFSLVWALKGRSGLPTGEASSVFPVVVFLVLLNSAVNPYIFTLTNSKYRQAFREALCCCCPKRRVGVATGTDPPRQNDARRQGTQRTLQTECAPTTSKL